MSLLWIPSREYSPTGGLIERNGRKEFRLLLGGPQSRRSGPGRTQAGQGSVSRCRAARAQSTRAGSARGERGRVLRGSVYDRRRGTVPQDSRNDSGGTADPFRKRIRQDQGSHLSEGRPGAFRSGFEAGGRPRRDNTRGSRAPGGQSAEILCGRGVVLRDPGPFGRGGAPASREPLPSLADHAGLRTLRQDRRSAPRSVSEPPLGEYDMRVHLLQAGGAASPVPQCRLRSGRRREGQRQYGASRGHSR